MREVTAVTLKILQQQQQQQWRRRRRQSLLAFPFNIGIAHIKIQKKYKNTEIKHYLIATCNIIPNLSTVNFVFLQPFFFVSSDS